jgi:hypothetical protein
MKTVIDLTNLKGLGDAARCYISGPRDEIIVLARGNTPYWNYWQEPVR